MADTTQPAKYEWTPEEQAEHRRLWVEALRSGEYTQAKESLRNPDGFCCLGVACDISWLVIWRQATETDISLSVGTPLGFMFAECEGATGPQSERGILPGLIADWLGLISIKGSFGFKDQRSLITMNDQGNSFEAIADVIETEPSLLGKRTG